MTIPFAAYTAAGLVQGDLALDGRLGDLVETQAVFPLRDAVLEPLERGEVERAALVELPADDVLVIVAPDDSLPPAHAAWHPVRLVTGPYLVTAELPTLPGFDPARALARPGGEYVLLGRVRLGLVERPEAGTLEHRFAWVGRYTVERVETDIDLVLYFPGARIVLGDPAPAPS